MIRNSYSLDYFFIKMFGHFLDKKFSWLFFGNHAKSYLDIVRFGEMMVKQSVLHPRDYLSATLLGLTEM